MNIVLRLCPWGLLITVIAFDVDLGRHFEATVAMAIAIERPRLLLMGLSCSLFSLVWAREISFCITGVCCCELVVPTNKVVVTQHAVIFYLCFKLSTTKNVDCSANVATFGNFKHAQRLLYINSFVISR